MGVEASGSGGTEGGGKEGGGGGGKEGKEKAAKGPSAKVDKARERDLLAQVTTPLLIMEEILAAHAGREVGAERKRARARPPLLSS